MSPAHADRRALAALVAGAACIGLAPIFVRWIDVGYTAAAFWRVALALPVLGLLWLPRRAATVAAQSATGGPGLGWLWLAGAFFAADLAVWHQSVRYTSVANATLLANLAPVFVTFAAWRLFHEKVGPRFMVGLVLAIGGAALLVADSLTVGASTALGDLLGIAAAVFYAGYQLGVSRLRRSASAFQVMWWTSLASAVVLLPVVLLVGDALWPASLRGWAVLLGLALVNQVLGQGLIAYGMAHLPASLSSVSLLVQPLAAALFAWLLLGERFGAQQALGGAVVIAGIVLCRLALVRNAPAPAGQP